MGRLVVFFRFALCFFLGMLLLLPLVNCGSGKKAVVAPTVTVAITPKTPTVALGGTQLFTAAVTGTTNTAVTWAVTETGGGTIDSTGKYTAAAKAGTYHVTATSQASAQATDTATVTITAPAPTFTSTAPTTAVEGGLYTYTVTATDDSGGTDITFSLKNSPSGATISAGTISWTPTTAESRTDNSFTVVATTAVGGVNTQSWIVNPNGTIRGSWIDTYWSAKSKTPYPNDLSGGWLAISALVPNSDGTATTIAGTGNSDGTFTIPNVPAGYFWLTFQWNSYDNEAYWTNSAVYDLGTDYTGLPWVSDPCNATLNLTLSGLDNDKVDGLRLLVPNKGWDNWYQQSGTILTGSVPVCPIDPTVGDAAYFVQTESLTLPSGFEGEGEVVGPALALPTTFAVADGASATFTGVLTNNPTSTNVRLRRSDWVGSFANVGAVNPVPDELEAQEILQPFVSDRATGLEEEDGLTSLWYVGGDAQSWNVDPGTIQFNNPYPSSWLPLFGAYGYAEMIDNAGNQQGIYNSYTTTATQTNGFVPLMSAIQSPTMNGADLYTAATSPTTAVTLSWTAPTGLAPFGYEIRYYCTNGCSGGPGEWGYIYTALTSLTFPAGFLNAGSTYQFEITAMADSKASILTSPYRGGYPQAYANVYSAPLTITSSTPDSTKGLRSSKAASGQKQINHTKTGAYLVTTHGNQPLDAKARMLARFSHSQSSKTTKPVSAVTK